MFVLGIVGSIASGKSTVSAYLQTQGATWIDADQIAKSLLDTEDVKLALIHHFGEEITDQNGDLDRSVIASRVFGDDDVRRQELIYLESVIHPRVRTEIHRILHTFDSPRVPVALLDVPLLFESDWHYCCDSIWCVDAPRETRINRVKQRNWDPQQLLRRESNQLDILTKRQLSNHVIENHSHLEHLHRVVHAQFSELITKIKHKTSTDRHCEPNQA